MATFCGRNGSPPLWLCVHERGRAVAHLLLDEMPPCPGPFIRTRCLHAVRRINASIVFVAVSPSIEGPTQAIGVVLCDRSAVDRGMQAMRHAAGLRRTLRGLRAVEITHPVGGRA
jgi:hypothetical protein